MHCITNLNSTKQILKGSCVATVFSLLFVLIFAFIVRLFSLSENTIPVANQIIKILSVTMATFFVIKHTTKGYLKGMAIGVGFVVLSSVAFLLLGGAFNLKSVLIDLIVCALIGCFCGIIAVNIKK